VTDDHPEETMNVIDATEDYERWLGRQIELVPDDLDRKHKRMRESPFVFLRASHYLWLQRLDELAPELDAPRVGCVGDLHVENFGTWRDAEGRLVWGVNDFDESEQLPYTDDLARLATSAVLAIADEKLHSDPGDACAAIARGYADGIASGGRPFVLAGEHEELARLVAAVMAPGPRRWWKDFLADELKPPTPDHDRVPQSAQDALAAVRPGPGWTFDVHRRVAGVGSLGRRRIVLVGDHDGAPVARELKQLAPPAGAWLGRPATPGVRLEAAVRAQDPYVSVRGGWVARRLAPDCVKLELSVPEGSAGEERLLERMGAETANVHLASADAVAAVRHDLRGRPRRWLEQAASRLADALREDWEDWRRHSRGTRTDPD
jgi:hypothetical protein